MTQHEAETPTIAMALELLAEHGLEGIASAAWVLITEARQIERSAFLVVAPREQKGVFQ